MWLCSDSSKQLLHLTLYLLHSGLPGPQGRYRDHVLLPRWVDSVPGLLPMPPATELLFSAGSSPLIQSQSAVGAVTKYPRLGGINNRRSVSQIRSCQSMTDVSAGLSSGCPSWLVHSRLLFVSSRGILNAERDRLFFLPLTRTLTHHEAPLLTNLTLFTSQRPWLLIPSDSELGLTNLGTHTHTHTHRVRRRSQAGSLPSDTML